MGKRAAQGFLPNAAYEMFSGHAVRHCPVLMPCLHWPCFSGPTAADDSAYRALVWT